MEVEKVIVLDFGSQYTQLIARRLRELEVFCEILPYSTNLDFGDDVKAVILSGSPFSVNDPNALNIDLEKLVGKIPILGICYGAQLIAKTINGKVHKSDKREYGKAKLLRLQQDAIFDDLPSESQVWMSHGDSILDLPNEATIIAKTNDIPIAAYKITYGVQDAYCLQFHPEVTHSEYGALILKNFVRNIAQIKYKWTAKAFIEQSVISIRERVADQKVLLGLSGGVDSTVAGTLLHKAIGENLYCLFIDNGLLRKNEYLDVLNDYKSLGLNVFGYDASNEFLTALEGVSDPEQKRKIIGKVFIDVFEREGKKMADIQWLAQGTIYPDVIESVSVHGPSVTIKSHHNVGGLPDKMELQIIEPLRMLFKDEVRRVGEQLGIPYSFVGRHPFPGPGLAIRILGSLDAERIRLCQESDYIFINALKNHNLYDKVWQAGAILLPIKSVGVMGDERTYENTIALRCVNSIDGMTAEWAKLPYEFLGEVSSEIINKVKGINRVVYDISTKPPATIEWE